MTLCVDETGQFGPGPEVERAQARGPICPMCRWFDRQGLPHACMAKDMAYTMTPAHLFDFLPLRLNLHRLHQDYPEDFIQLFTELREHPAAPLRWEQEGHYPIVRRVHPTWCFCQCGPPPKERA